MAATPSAKRRPTQFSNCASISSPAWKSTKIEQEYKELLEAIKDLLDILAKEARVFTIIKEELREFRTKYATPRLTEIVPDEGEIAIEDLIANEGVIITSLMRPDQAHQRQRVSRATPRRQRRDRHGHARRRHRRRGQAISSSISSPPARTIT